MRFLLLAVALILQAQDDSQARKHFDERNAERRQLWQRKEFAKAVALLEEAIEAGYTNYANARSDPDFASICAEYAAVAVGAARALGMPARELGLMTRDVETRPSGAGHAVAEVWLAQFRKWVFADAQWDVIPERHGVPLNAVEFQDAIARDAAGLACRTSSGAMNPTVFQGRFPIGDCIFISAPAVFYREPEAK